MNPKTRLMVALTLQFPRHVAQVCVVILSGLPEHFKFCCAMVILVFDFFDGVRAQNHTLEIWTLPLIDKLDWLVGSEFYIFRKVWLWEHWLIHTPYVQDFWRRYHRMRFEQPRRTVLSFVNIAVHLIQPCFITSCGNNLLVGLVGANKGGDSGPHNAHTGCFHFLSARSPILASRVLPRLSN